MCLYSRGVPALSKAFLRTEAPLLLPARAQPSGAGGVPAARALRRRAGGRHVPLLRQRQPSGGSHGARGGRPEAPEDCGAAGAARLPTVTFPCCRCLLPVPAAQASAQEKLKYRVRVILRSVRLSLSQPETKPRRVSLTMLLTVMKHKKCGLLFYISWRICRPWGSDRIMDLFGVAQSQLASYFLAVGDSYGIVHFLSSVPPHR